MDYVWSPPVAAGVDAAQDSNAGATDCMTAHPATDNMQWAQLNGAQQAGARALGWTEESWTCDTFPSHNAGGVEECNVPPSNDYYWSDMSPSEVAGAQALGWTAEAWDCGIGHIEFAFACSEDAEVTFSFETHAQAPEGAVNTGNGWGEVESEHSFFVEIDQGDWQVFRVPPTDDWTVHHDSARDIQAPIITILITLSGSGVRHAPERGFLK